MPMQIEPPLPNGVSFRAYRSIFPCGERLCIGIRSRWREFFLDVTKKTRLKVGFGNYLRCSS
jgi:hypothetical protein